YKLDIYPYYGSDGEALWRAGADVIVGLIGPGVDASHHYERTHIDSLVASARLIADDLPAEHLPLIGQARPVRLVHPHAHRARAPERRVPAGGVAPREW